MNKNNKHRSDDRLKLHSETVKTLTPEETEQAVAGITFTTTTPICMSLTCAKPNNGH
jgi:hypothetical protein